MVLDKALNQVFFTAELDTGVDGLQIYSPQNLLVLAVGRMELFGQGENVINIDLHLTNQFYLKFYVIIDIFSVTIGLGAILLIEVDVGTLVILEGPFGQKLGSRQSGQTCSGCFSDAGFYHRA